MEQPNILLIEDDNDLRDLIAQALTFTGKYTVHVAEDGEAGLEAVYQARPHCIIMDVKMPRLNGFQLVRILRGDPDTQEIPLVILSALVQDHEVFTGLSSGADRYLLKPVKLHVLMTTIQEVLLVSEHDRLQRMRDLVDSSNQDTPHHPTKPTDEG